MSLISSWPGKLKTYLATQHPLDCVSVTFKDVFHVVHNSRSLHVKLQGCEYVFNEKAISYLKSAFCGRASNERKNLVVTKAT